MQQKCKFDYEGDCVKTTHPSLYYESNNECMKNIIVQKNKDMCMGPLPKFKDTRDESSKYVMSRFSTDDAGEGCKR